MVESVVPVPRFPETGRGAGRQVDASALTDVFNEFAATVTGEFTLDDILRQLAQGISRVLEVDGAGVSAPAQDGRLLHLVYATEGPSSELEHLQEALQEGPCWVCHDSGRVVNLADLSTEGAWPRYQEHAEQLGIRAVAALPLQARGQRWGVLDLYRSEAVPLSSEELATATTLANLATSYLVVAQDRDVARRAERELGQRAMHDALTGLPVRWVFLDHLKRALSRLQRGSLLAAVLFIDVDGLKYVNDTFGHAAGDRLLVACAQRVSAALRPGDVVARIGGDEFVVLLERVEHADDALTVARRIAEGLGAPYPSDGRVIRPSASIGIALSADPSTPGATVVAHADSAMYEAKRAQRGGIRVFEPHAYALTRAGDEARDRLGGELREALGTGELEVYYQPIYHLPRPGAPEGDPAGRLYAVEALVRWNHPRQGLLTAAAFIDTAERAGLLPAVGMFVLPEACRQLRRWRGDFPDVAPSQLFVNMSAAELSQPHLVDQVVRVLTEARIEPDVVTIEVTETGLMQHGGRETRALESLRQLGFALAMDDFGTGYSSLSRLVDIPVSALKIDQSFTVDVAEDPRAAAVVAAVRLLGHELDRTVIAEGVEDAATLDRLRSIGIEYFQGFHLALPVTGAAMTELLAGLARPGVSSSALG